MDARTFIQFDKMPPITPPKESELEGLAYKDVEEFKDAGGYYLGLWDLETDLRAGFGYYVYVDGALYVGEWAEDK